MTKREVGAAIELVMIRARYATSTGNLPALRVCVEESCDLLGVARTLRSPKVVKQVKDAFWTITGMEQFVADGR